MRNIQAPISEVSDLNQDQGIPCSSIIKRGCANLGLIIHRLRYAFELEISASLTTRLYTCTDRSFSRSQGEEVVHDQSRLNAERIPLLENEHL